MCFSLQHGNLRVEMDFDFVIRVVTFAKILKTMTMILDEATE